MKKSGLLVSLSFPALLILGCAQPTLTDKTQISNEKLSAILNRIQNVTKQKYALSSKELQFPAAETLKIESYEALGQYLEGKGYVVEIIANKYRTDMPKVVEVFERGKYAGSMSTITYFPLKGKFLNDVLLDFGLTTKYTVIMSEDVLAESTRVQKPSDLFTGKTAADFIRFVESAYDYHVDIDQQAAIINVKKYKSEVINILADKEQIQKDSRVFLEQDIDNKKNKQFACDNGKIFVTGTPLDINRVKAYADEVNALNASKVMISFDGKKSIQSALTSISGQKGMKMELLSGDFIPEKDTSVWFETQSDIDEYIRKNYNKKMVMVGSMDRDADGIKESFSCVVSDIKGVSLSTPTTVASFFKQLSNMDGNYYIVDGDANIPVSKIVVDDFEHLNAYMWSAMGVKLTMTDPGNGMPKIIRVGQ